MDFMCVEFVTVISLKTNTFYSRQAYFSEMPSSSKIKLKLFRHHHKMVIENHGCIMIICRFIF